MKAVALIRHLPVDDPQAWADLDLPAPEPGPRDLRVAVKAVSVNPVDTKVRSQPALLGQAPEGGHRILGWDGAGVVEAVGPEVSLFEVGDEVYFAGAIQRAGSQAEFVLVDERIAALKPRTLGFAQAAALPLTTITAWEAMFERLGLSPDGGDAGKRLLIIGGAGGVGSVAIQLARQAGLHVIATASRPESIAWVKDMGAQDVINHHGDLQAQLADVGGEVDHIFLASDTDPYFDKLPALLKPQGSVVAIVDNQAPLNLSLYKPKSLAFHWEMMFTRPMFTTPDIQAQHALLTRVAQWVDQGLLRSTVQQVLSPISAAQVQAVHTQLASGRTLGKWVLEGF